ncbi:unnamed protein product [Arabidopsis halleri]
MVSSVKQTLNLHHLVLCIKPSDSSNRRLPLYGEIKIALLVYLWYPKSQGLSYVYEKLLCPYLSKYESDIDQGISVLKIRGHLVIAQLLQCGFHWSLQIFKQLQQQFTIDKNNNPSQSKDQQQTRTSFLFLR